jgi:hypothetical protein
VTVRARLVAAVMVALFASTTVAACTARKPAPKGSAQSTGEKLDRALGLDK